MAAGDALGAGYEFRSPPQGGPHLIGGGLGNWDPGVWTDDTQMGVCIAEVAATRTLDPVVVGAEEFADEAFAAGLAAFPLSGCGGDAAFGPARGAVPGDGVCAG